MTDHTIPPRELVEQWASEKCYDERDWLYELHIANRAAQWGADQELEACLRLVEIEAGEGAYDLARYIRAARRPEPMSLKKLALLQLDVLNADLFERGLGRDLSQIRHALEQIDD